MRKGILPDYAPESPAHSRRLQTVICSPEGSRGKCRPARRSWDKSWPTKSERLLYLLSVMLWYVTGVFDEGAECPQFLRCATVRANDVLLSQSAAGEGVAHSFVIVL